MKFKIIIILVILCVNQIACTSKNNRSASKIKSDTVGNPRNEDTLDEPIKISLPTITPPPTKATSNSIKSTSAEQIESATEEILKINFTTKKTKTASSLLNRIGDNLICPEPGNAEFQLFPTRCQKNQDCRKQGKNYRCCQQYGLKICVKGSTTPLKEENHQPIFGVIPRKCPNEPLAELWWQVQTCATDNDCWPRVCCPDGGKRYCRTARPEFESIPLPAARQLSYPFQSIAGYIQCTPPPPAAFDTHPKSCNTTIDCFPNVCCQEAGNKFCRPPKRSLLALLTTFSQVAKKV